METYKFLADEKELKWFYDYCVDNILSPLEEYCFAVAARGKKLSDEEKEKYQMGRAEMLMTQIVSSKKHEPFTFERFKKSILRFEVNKEAYTTHSGMAFPEKTLVCYFYINPCDTVKVLNSLSKKIANLTEEFVHCAVTGSKNGTLDNIEKTKALLHKVTRMYPTCPSHKRLLDFDIDLAEEADKAAVLALVKETADKLFGKGGYVIVDTSGGFHILVNVKKITFSPRDFTSEVEEKLGESCKECILNKNGFIPCPGTLQYGRLVKIVNKEDFE